MIALLYQEALAHTQSLALLKALAEDFPKDPSYLKDLGVTQFLAGRIPDAITTLREAIRLDPGSLEARLSLGTIYADSDRIEDARRIYDEALAARTPDEKGLKKIIKANRARLPR